MPEVDSWGGSDVRRLVGWAVRRPRPVVAADRLPVPARGRRRAAARAPTRARTRSSTVARRASRPPRSSSSQFGDDPVVVLVRGDLRRARADRQPRAPARTSRAVSRARVAEGQQAMTETCAQIAELDPSQVVFGPATFLNQSAIQAEEFLETADAGGARAGAGGGGRRRRAEAARTRSVGGRCSAGRRGRVAGGARPVPVRAPRPRRALGARPGRPGSTIRDSSPRWCATAASRSARRRRSSPTCSRAPMRR